MYSVYTESSTVINNIVFLKLFVRFNSCTYLYINILNSVYSLAESSYTGGCYRIIRSAPRCTVKFWFLHIVGTSNRNRSVGGEVKKDIYYRKRRKERVVGQRDVKRRGLER